MKKSTSIRRPAQPSEEGFVLLAVLVLVVLLTIALSVALPKISKQIQRDREFETMERGKQYIRAVRMYYKKYGSYPPNIDALVKPGPGGLRYLRKKYADPTTGKADWKPIQYGQNKAPTVMGFFGKPLGGAGTACAGNGLGGSSTTDSSALTSTFGSSTSTSSSTNCASTGLSTSSDTTTAASGTSSTDSSATSSTTSSTTGLSGQTFGGAGIMGFSPNSPKKSIMVYKTKNKYNEWEFVYDPVAEQLQAAGQAGAGGTGTGLTSSGTAGSTTPTTSTTSTTPTTQ